MADRIARDVVVTGGTGYVGRPLIANLLSRGHRVVALARSASRGRVPDGAMVVEGSALAEQDVARVLSSGCTLVLLVGTPHPGPSKAREFREVDLASVRAAAAVVTASRVAHVVYMSVAHPAPVMRAYIAVRSEGERLLEATGTPVTVLRPWYVLGPGHWWPYALKPAYWLLEHVPSTRDSALRLGLVTRPQMLAAVTYAVENPPASGVRVMDVPAIRAAHP